MFAPDVLDPAVAFLARLAGAGPALELAIGTGRVAIPLARRGIPVSGIELSEPMVDQLRHKASAEELPVVVGDMATAVAPGSFSLVYVSMNGGSGSTSSNSVDRTLTISPMSRGRVNTQLMQLGQKKCCVSAPRAPPITGSPEVTAKVGLG